MWKEIAGHFIWKIWQKSPTLVMRMSYFSVWSPCVNEVRGQTDHKLPGCILQVCGFNEKKKYGLALTTFLHRILQWLVIVSGEIYSPLIIPLLPIRVFERLIMCLNALCRIVNQNAHRPHSSALFPISLTIRKLSSGTYDCQHQLSELPLYMERRPLGLICLVQLLPGSRLTNCHSSACIQKMTEMRYWLDANGKNKKTIKFRLIGDYWGIDWGTYGSFGQKREDWC